MAPRPDSNEGAAERLIDHAAYLWRDGLNAVFGMDESGHMDAMGLGWVIMAPEGDRPLILQKAGGLQGIFSYVAFAPARNIGVVVAINAFEVDADLRWRKPRTTHRRACAEIGAPACSPSELIVQAKRNNVDLEAGLVNPVHDGIADRQVPKILILVLAKDRPVPGEPVGKSGTEHPPFPDVRGLVAQARKGASGLAEDLRLIFGFNLPRPPAESIGHDIAERVSRPPDDVSAQSERSLIADDIAAVDVGRRRSRTVQSMAAEPPKTRREGNI